MKGRVIHFDYVKDQLRHNEIDSLDEQELKDLVQNNKVSIFNVRNDISTLVRHVDLENCTNTLTNV